MSLQAIRDAKVLPAVTLNRAADSEHLADALLAGGLKVIEITFRTDAAEESIRRITKHRPEVVVGAGTILRPEEIRRAIDAGATFGVSPGCNEEVIEEAAANNFPIMPGVVTPSEIEKGMRLGCMFLKFFPAEVSGGSAALKALSGPYAHTGVRFIATGGITAANMGQYLALPIVDAICGSWFVNAELIANANWGQITEYTRGALDMAHHTFRSE